MGSSIKTIKTEIVNLQARHWRQRGNLRGCGMSAGQDQFPRTRLKTKVRDFRSSEADGPGGFASCSGIPRR